MDKKSVSSKFGIKQVEVFESWLHTLSILRNMAAHHDRFLGARIGVAPTNLKQRRIIFSDSKAPYASLTMINILLKSIDFGDSFKSRLMAIESTYGVEQFKLLGFPDDWHISGSGW
jgi:abortive infection bacteriophage resistance protein